MSILGKVVLYVGIESRNWTDDDLTNACKFARDHHIDTIAVKVADGTGRWYTTIDDIVHRHQLCNSLGVGYLPYTYCYGPKFGIIQGECEILNEIRSSLGFVMADMEAEWNGNVAAAHEFVSYMQGNTNHLYITTWANPNEQGWHDVLQILAPVTEAFNPQQYDNFLATRYTEYGTLKIWPAVDVTNEFGPNDPAEIARQALSLGEETLFIWEYHPAQQNTATLDAIVESFTGTISPPPPMPPLPTPVQVGTTYHVQPGDSLSSIAAKYPGVSWQDIWMKNRSLIGSNPNMIQSGWDLVIPSQGSQKTYIVQPGDSLSSISTKIGMSNWQQLYQENIDVIGQDPNIIRPGEELHY